MFRIDENNLEIIEYYHRGQTPWVRFLDRMTNIEQTEKAEVIASLCGVSRRTLARWCDGSQAMPLSANRLIQVHLFGVMPWSGWQSCRVKLGRNQQDSPEWMIVSHQWPSRFHFTPGVLNMFAAGMDDSLSRINALKDEVDRLRETVNALSTRKPPPLPCAEIVPFSHYQKLRKLENQ